MTDKEKLSAVRANIEKRKESLKPHGGQGLVVTRLMRELCDDFLSFIDSMQEEPVSDDLENEIQDYYNSRREYGGRYNAIIPVYRHQLADIARHFANWQKEQDKQWLAEEHKNIFAKGRDSMKEQMMKNIWKPADGDELPEYDREVIALLDNGKVVFAHRPPEYWDGKDIITGKVTRNYVERYDKGMWNIPNVKYWLDVELPK